MLRYIHRKEVLENLKRHRNMNPKLLSKIKDIPAHILENLGSDLAKKAVSMSREVEGDLYGHKAFLRFNISPHGILYAESKKMVHHNEESLLIFFKKRFPTLTILFKSNRGVFALINDSTVVHSDLSLNEALLELETILPLDPISEDLQKGNYHDLWRNFAKSQIISNRKVSKQIISLSKKWNDSITVEEQHSQSLDSFL